MHDQRMTHPLPWLQTLHLENNSLTGSLPPSLGDQIQLAALFPG